MRGRWGPRDLSVNVRCSDRLSYGALFYSGRELYWVSETGSSHTFSVPSPGCAVPVFGVGRDVDDCSGQYLLCRFPFFLIPAATCDTYQHLSAAFCGLVDVPVVAASGLECDIEEWYLLGRYGCKPATSAEIFRIARVGLADRKYHLALEAGHCVVTLDFVGPYVLGKPECAPCLWLSGIEGDVGYYLGSLGACDAVLLGFLKMICQRAVGDALRDERGDCDKAAVAEREQVVAAPDLAEEYVVVEMGELRGELAKLLTPCCLYDFLLCHTWNYCCHD